jgi:hypothetical protein
MVGVQLVKTLFPDSDWAQRYEDFLAIEADIVRNLPIRSALH